MDLRVTLEIMLTNKALAAAVAFELTISKMCLNVGSDVFFPTENLSAVLIETCPLACHGVLFTDVALDFFWSNASVLETGIYIEIVEECLLLVVIGSQGNTNVAH